MNVLGLCDGMSCLQIAMKELGLPIDKYYASEIDKFAIKQAQYNFPNTIQLGSITDVDISKLDKIDFIGAGTPCTNFSFAGKRKGMSIKEPVPFVKPSLDDYDVYLSNEDSVYLDYEDYCEREETKHKRYCDSIGKETVEIYTLERYLELKEQGFEFEGESYLFWEFMRILRDVQKYNPDVLFLLENVEMGKKWERVLSEAVGVFGVHINSALVSAQNRKRIYWTNIRTKQEGLFGELHTDIPQPEDRCILLRDILEEEVDEKYFISQAVINRMNRKGYSSPKINPNKTGTVNTKNNSGQMSIDSGTTFISVQGKVPTQRSSTGRCLDKKHNYQFIKTDKQYRPKPNQDKECFTAGGHSAGNHSDMDLICVALRGRDVSCLSPKRTEYGKQIRKEYEAGILKEQRKNIQRLEPRSDGKTNTITSVQKDNLIMGCDYRRDEDLRIRGEMVELSLRAEKTMTIDASYYKGFGVRGNSCRQLAESYKRGESFIRRLTPTEVVRLQTVPKWYEWIVSDSQIYKMCGNGWTVEVIKHILNFIR